MDSFKKNENPNVEIGEIGHSEKKYENLIERLIKRSRQKTSNYLLFIERTLKKLTFSLLNFSSLKWLIKKEMRKRIS